MTSKRSSKSSAFLRVKVVNKTLESDISAGLFPSDRGCSAENDAGVGSGVI